MSKPKKSPRASVSSKPSSPKKTNRRENSANPDTLMSGIFDQFPGCGSSMLSMPFQLSYDNAYNPLTLNRILLTQSYMTHGVIQTVVNQPVEDALRGGVELHSDELDAEDIEDFQEYLRQNEILQTVKMARFWARLYGGAGIIINTDQDPKTELNEEQIGPKTPLAFIAADRWELTLGYVNPDMFELPYNYYGQTINKTRVIRTQGIAAPSFLRQRLQGWEMSVLECMIRQIQLYTKAEDMIFELIDEAKIDVMKIDGYNSSGLSPEGQRKTNQRLEAANQTKNYRRMLVMDKEDDWAQKQLTFSGIGELLNQIRIGQAASCKIPMAKLYGLSAAGFNSGEDDIENYNAIVEGIERHAIHDILTVMLPLCARQFFGREVSFRIKFKALRVLSAEQEENVKAMKTQRYSTQYSQGMLTPQEYAEINMQEELTPIDTAVLNGAEAVPPEAPMTDIDKPQKVVKTKAA